MSYLVCDECNSYYELQPGETPEDYDLECECGGKFEYKESIKSDNESEGLDKKYSIWIRLIAILSGVIIVILSGLSLLDIMLEIPRIFILTLVIAGFVTGFIAGGSYKDGIINSAVAGLLGGMFLWFSLVCRYVSLEGHFFCIYHMTIFT